MTLLTGSRLAGLVAAALAAAAGLVGLSSAPAAAALCSDAGVNVVVDFNGLGGGVQKGCDPQGAGRTADHVFPAAGFALTYAQRQPGFVCRVKGSPSNDPCMNTSPANATWGLYWSDGKSGTWHYSNTGVGGLKVSDGGFLAFSWQNGGAMDPPSATPTNSKPPSPTPTKTSTPTPKPTRTPTKAPGGGSSQPTESPKPTKAAVGASSETSSAAPRAAASAKAKAAARASVRASAGARASAGPTPSASTSASTESSASDEATPEVTATKEVNSAFAPEEEHSGLPVWVPLGVIVVLAGAAGGTAWWRRRTGAA